MIDFNWTEVFVLGVLAVVIFGPERLPEFARKAARVIAYLRAIGNDARGQLRKELGPEFDDFHLSDLNPKSFVSRHLLSPEDKDDLLTIRDELRSTGAIANAALHGDDTTASDEDGEPALAGATAASASEHVASAQRVIAFDPEAT